VTVIAGSLRSGSFRTQGNSLARSCAWAVRWASRRCVIIGGHNKRTSGLLYGITSNLVDARTDWGSWTDSADGRGTPSRMMVPSLISIMRSA
jgi:hypothetical protein